MKLSHKIGLAAVLGAIAFGGPASGQGPVIIATGNPPVAVSATNPLPVTGTVTASNPSVGTNGAAIPGSSTLIGTKDGSGNLQPASAANPVPVSNAGLNGATHAQCAALCANLVVKNAAGTLFSFEVGADSTLSGAAWWIMIYDAASAPSDGAVTPTKCYAMPSGATGFNGAFATGGVAFTTGVTIGVSTTGCFTKTASTHAFVSGDFQ